MGDVLCVLTFQSVCAFLRETCHPLNYLSLLKTNHTYYTTTRRHCLSSLKKNSNRKKSMQWQTKVRKSNSLHAVNTQLLISDMQQSVKMMK